MEYLAARQFFMSAFATEQCSSVFHLGQHPLSRLTGMAWSAGVWRYLLWCVPVL